MDIIFLFLTILSIIATLIGLIKPQAVLRWGKLSKKTRRNVLKYYGIGVLLFSTLFGASSDEIDVFSNTNPNVNDLEVHFIDVGQADSILIKFGTEAMLIDAGNNNDADFLVNYIKSQGISILNYAIGTHPHEDHIGGLDAVIASFEVGKIIMPKQNSTTKTFEDVLTAIRNKGLKVTTPKVGDTYNLGEAKWTILAPNQEEYNETNNASIVIKLEYGDNSFMFTGDAEELSEQEILSLGNLQAEVLKVGHHGSSSSTTDEFLNEVNPTYAVISVGLNNSYGHPHEEVLERLNNRNIEILRTDEVGTIIFTSDGTNLKFRTER